MSDKVLTNERRTARKVYACDATEWFHKCGMGRHDLTPDQQVMFDAAEAAKGRILPGQVYHYKRAVCDGQMQTWRARLDMESVCLAHGLFDD